MFLVALMLMQTAPPFDIKGDYQTMARTHCASEWPDNFMMQEHCLKAQRAGALQFKQVYEELGKPIEKALERCVEDWTTNRIPNFMMIGHCAKTQAESYRRLNG